MDGFVAPLHLVDGMLAQFEDSWSKVIAEFRRELEFEETERLFGRTIMRRLQLFVLDCWLQWGPSIPICGCRRWSHHNGMIALQYGYGDENNSMPLLPLIGKDGTPYSYLLAAMKTALLAVKFPLTVRPVWIPPSGVQVASSSVRDSLNCLGTAQNLIGQKSDEGSLVLDYVSSPTLSTSADVSDCVQKSQSSQHDYYSAYVWSMFVLCWRDYKGKSDSSELGQILNGVGGQPVFQPRAAATHHLHLPMCLLICLGLACFPFSCMAILPMMPSMRAQKATG